MNRPALSYELPSPFEWCSACQETIPPGHVHGCPKPTPIALRLRFLSWCAGRMYVRGQSLTRRDDGMYPAYLVPVSVADYFAYQRSFDASGEERNG